MQKFFKKNLKTNNFLVEVHSDGMKSLLPYDAFVLRVNFNGMFIFFAAFIEKTAIFKGYESISHFTSKLKMRSNVKFNSCLKKLRLKYENVFNAKTPLQGLKEKKMYCCNTLSVKSAKA